MTVMDWCRWYKRFRGEQSAFCPMTGPSLGILVCNILAVGRLPQRADALAVDRRGEAEQLPADEIGEQERVRAALVKPGDVAREQRRSLLVGERQGRHRGGGIALERLAKRAVVERVAA